MSEPNGMGDLGAVLDATEPVNCQFLNHIITAHVYSAGAARLTKEERAILRAVDAVEGETVEIPEDADEKLTREVSEQIYNRNVDLSRRILPIMIKSWDLDGSPMALRGELLPPTPENVARCPDALIVEVAVMAMDVWKRPTNGGLLQSGSPAEATPGQNQTANTTP